MRLGRSGEFDAHHSEKFQETLMSFYARYLVSVPPFESDNLGIIVLWHLAFMSLCVDFEPAIHVPRAMFLAAVSWYCYTQYGPDGGPNDVLTHGPLNFPKMALLEVNLAMLLFKANGFKLGKPAAIEARGALCGWTGLLQHIGHWEITRKFGSILGALIHNEANPNG